MEKKRVTIDFESRSCCDLKKSGAYKYSLDPTTEPTCLAFKPHGGPINILKYDLINTPWMQLPSGFRNLWNRWISEDYLFVCHNSFFETCLYKNILVKRYGWPDIPFEKFRCTAAKAAACALPRNLEGAGAAMDLSTQKDKTGYIAMMKTCKPTKAWNAWNKLQIEYKSGKRLSEKKKQKAIDEADHEPKQFLDPEDDPQVWADLYKYCKIDVATEELLDDALPDLIPSEQEIWFLNQKLNWRGLRIDIPAVKKIVGMIDAESKTKLKELDSLTMGLVTKPGARRSILEFLALDGIELPDIKSKTVEDALKGDKLTGDMKTLLELRKALSMTSTRKYQGFLARANEEDDRVRDILMYHGASTGRDTGTGVQPHNFPRGVIKTDKSRPYAAIENILKYDIDMLKLLYGENLSMLFSSVLRNMILPSKGKKLYAGDFSKIEVCVLWWLAENTPGLEVLNSGKDPYIYQAAKNLNKTYEEVEAGVKAGEQWAIDARQLGKGQVLGCGFGMGPPKFLITAWDMYRLKLTEEQSIDAVKSYRDANFTVPELWKLYEKAAVTAIETGRMVIIKKCKFFVKNKFLWIELPSGRRLAYRSPRLVWRETDFGPRGTIEFMAVNSKTKKWGWERTWGGTLTENIVQAVARDIMMGAAVRLEKADYLFLLQVHDEGIAENEAGSVEEFTKIMCERPTWADKYLPIEAEGWSGERYRK